MPDADAEDITAIVNRLVEEGKIVKLQGVLKKDTGSISVTFDKPENIYTNQSSTTLTLKQTYEKYYFVKDL